MSNLVVEHGESSFSRRLRRRRFAVAGVVAGLEAVLVLVDTLLVGPRARGWRVGGGVRWLGA